jgi:hypothetical protein
VTPPNRTGVGFEIEAFVVFFRFQGFVKAAEKIPQILSFFDMHSDYVSALQRHRSVLSRIT